MTTMTARLVEIDPADEDALRAESRRIFKFLMGLHSEVGIGTPNPGKAMQGIYERLRDGAVVHAERDGELVGSIGLYETDVWYADSTILVEQWAYVSPAERDGEALRFLLNVVARTADALGSFVNVNINNPHRKRVPHTRLERIGAALSYQPSGGSYVIPPG